LSPKIPTTKSLRVGFLQAKLRPSKPNLAKNPSQNHIRIILRCALHPNDDTSSLLSPKIPTTK